MSMKSAAPDARKFSRLGWCAAAEVLDETGDEPDPAERELPAAARPKTVHLRPEGAPYYNEDEFGNTPVSPPPASLTPERTPVYAPFCPRHKLSERCSAALGTSAQAIAEWEDAASETLPPRCGEAPPVSSSDMRKLLWFVLTRPSEASHSRDLLHALVSATFSGPRYVVKRDMALHGAHVAEICAVAAPQYIPAFVAFTATSAVDAQPCVGWWALERALSLADVAGWPRGAPVFFAVSCGTRVAVYRASPTSRELFRCTKDGACPVVLGPKPPAGAPVAPAGLDAADERTRQGVLRQLNDVACHLAASAFPANPEITRKESPSSSLLPL